MTIFFFPIWFRGGTPCVKINKLTENVFPFLSGPTPPVHLIDKPGCLFSKFCSTGISVRHKPGFHMICNGLQSVWDTIADRTVPLHVTDIWKHLSPAAHGLDDQES